MFKSPKLGFWKGSAKKDQAGNLVTKKSALLKLYKDTYIECVKSKPAIDSQKES